MTGGASREGPGTNGPRCEKPPRPEGHSGLSHGTVRTPLETVNPARRVLSLFLQPLRPTGGGLESLGVGFDADPGSVGDRQGAVGRQDERLGQVLGEIP